MEERCYNDLHTLGIKVTGRVEWRQIIKHVLDIMGIETMELDGGDDDDGS